MLAHNAVQAHPHPDLSPAEAARYLNVSPYTIRRYIREGRLPAERVGPRLLRIKVANLDALGREVNTTPPDPIREHALRVVAEAPKLTGEQLDRICALLRGVA